MIRYFLALLTLMVLPTALADVKTAPATKAAATTTAAPATTPEAFWNADALHVLHLKLARAAWDKMQPTRAGLFSGLLPPATRPAGEEVHGKSCVWWGRRHSAARRCKALSGACKGR